MNSKNLVILAGVAAALIGGAVWSTRTESRHTTALGLGDPVLPGLKEKLNEIAALSIHSGSATITVARTGDTWRVPGKWNYPADFNRVRDTLTKLSDLKVLQVLHTTPSDLAELQLQAAGSNLEHQANGIVLRNQKGDTLATLYAGKTHSRPGPSEAMGMGSFPDSQYVMDDKGQVSLVGEVLQDLQVPEQSWLDTEFVSLNDILSFRVSGCTKGDFEASRLTLGEEFKLAAAVPSGKDLDNSKLNQAGSVLSYLRFEDVANPRLTPAQTGLDKPVTYQARTQKGQIVTVKVGQATAQESSRYIAVTVAYEPPPMPAPSGTNSEAVAKAQAEQVTKAAAEAKALNEKLSPWVYAISRETAETLSWGLGDFLKDKPGNEDKKDNKTP